MTDQREALREALERLVNSAATLQTVDDDGETADFWYVPPEPLDLARDLLAALPSTPQPEGLDVERHRAAVSHALKEFGRHPWWPPTVDLSDTILAEYARLAPPPPEPTDLSGAPFHRAHVRAGYRHPACGACAAPPPHEPTR